MSQQSQRSLPDVLQDIVGDLQEIIRSEFRLGTTEMKEEAAKAVKPGVTLVTGVVFAVYASGFLLLSVLYGLTFVVPAWAAALIVSALVGLPAMVMIGKGRKGFKHIDIVPDKTVRSVKEDVQWAKNQAK
jgi:uncharacterized membrane protein YqjE